MIGSNTRGRSPQPSEEETLAKKDKDEFSFDNIMALAKKHNLRADEVKKRWEQFHKYDKDGDVVLSQQEFQKVVRSLIGLPDTEPIPDHLFNACWAAGDTDNDGNINFEEFLLWSTGVQYTEEMMVPDPEERMLRCVAREHGLELDEVERLKPRFDKFASDKAGITEHEFHDLVCELLHTNTQDFSDLRMKRHWREVNPSGGKLRFADFAVWWNSTFSDNGEMLMAPMSSMCSMKAGRTSSARLSSIHSGDLMDRRGSSKPRG